MKIYNALQITNPQVAYNLNKKRYYLYLIQKNQKFKNRPFTPYTPLYFSTSYDRIYNPIKQNVTYNA